MLWRSTPGGSCLRDAVLQQEAACSICTVKFKALYAGKFIGETKIVHNGVEIEQLRFVDLVLSLRRTQLLAPTSSINHTGLLSVALGSFAPLLSNSWPHMKVDFLAAETIRSMFQSI
jgi:hypothetical protein